MSDTETPVVPASPDLGSLSSADLATWRSTGEVPEPTESSDVTEASSTSQPDEQAASTDASIPAASEPAPSKKANAETRKAELNAEIQALLRQRDEIRASLSSAPRPTAPDVTTDSSPVTQPVSLDSVVSNPDLTQPILSEEQFYTQFPDATVGAFVRYTARYEQRLAVQEQRHLQTLEQEDSYRRDSLSSVTPEVITKLPRELMVAKSMDRLGPNEPVGPLNVAVHEILSSPKASELLAHIAEHPEVVSQLEATRTQSETIRTIAQIEARLGSPSVQPKPVGKPTTSAPPPPLTLGKKPSIPSDTVEEALASGDVKTYIREMNRREMAGQL